MASSEFIGLLGGTFDPVHNGHLYIAQAAYKCAHFDQLRIIPCNQSPHREQPVANAVQRLKMLKLATENISGLVIDDRELQRNSISYTYDALIELREDYPNARFCLIIGLDAFVDFEKWYRWQDILSLTQLLVICRPGYKLNSQLSIQDVYERHQLADFEQLKTAETGGILIRELNAPDISATNIRQRLQAGLKISGMVPTEIEQYLQRNEIYL